MEKYNFVGKNLTEEDKDKTSKNLSLSSALDNALGDSNERRKTEEELLLIKIATQLVNKELESLNVEAVSIHPAQVHVFSSKKFPQSKDKKREKGVGAPGNYSAIDSKIKMSSERVSDTLPFLKRVIAETLKEKQNLTNQESFLKIVTHEIIHHDSFHSFHLKKQNDDGKLEVGMYRVGYEIKSDFNKDYEHKHFVGFNEAVVSLTMEDILKNNVDLLSKETGITKENIQSELNKSGYFFQEALVIRIIEQIAKAEHKPYLFIWNEIKKNQFTGTMQYLREIEKVFGSGALRILASLDGRVYAGEQKLYLDNYLDYFNLSESSTERKIAAENILRELPKQEREAYDNHLEKMKDKNSN